MQTEVLVSKNSLGLCDQIEAQKLFSWLRITAAKGCRSHTESAKVEAKEGKVWEKPGICFKGSPLWSLTGMPVILAAKMCDNTREGKLT